MRQLKNDRITVFGSFVVDLMARVPRLPVPGETRASSSLKMGPGEKGFNQCVAAWKAGADATMMGKLGDDPFSQVHLKAMKELGMPDRGVMVGPGAATGNALIMVDESTGENLIAVTLGANATISAWEIEERADVITNCGILLVQLEMNPDALSQAIDLAWRNDALVIFNSAPASPFDAGLYEKISIITPNETEAIALTGIEIRSEQDARRAAAWFFNRGVEAVLITLGDQGVFVSDQTRNCLIEPIPVRVVDTTGAGDAFSGNLAASLARGLDLWDAAAYANAAAALSVTRIGTTPAMPERREVEALLHSIGPVH